MSSQTSEDREVTGTFPGCNLGVCNDHSRRDEQIQQLQEKLQVVENNTATVNKLTTRVNLLLTLMSLGTVTVLGGAIYTFTALSSFKDVYANDRIELQKQLTSMQKENLNAINSGLAILDANIDNRIDNMSDRLVKLEATLGNQGFKK